MQSNPYYLLIFFLFSTPYYAHAASPCAFQSWDDYRGTKLIRDVPSGAYIFTTLAVKVDADGAPNAYHPNDIGLHCTNGVGFKGLDCPANAGYPKSLWWSSVLVPDPKDKTKGYVQPHGAHKGFFVSQTSLKAENKSALNVSKYVDATSIPYLVFPRSFYKKKGTGSLGDFGYALNLENGKVSPFIVAEIGPPEARLGEMSIALGSALGGRNPNPRTGKGAPTGKVVYIVFPRSRKIPSWPLTQNQITSVALSLLDTAGGTEMLTECGDAL